MSRGAGAGPAVCRYDDKRRLAEPSEKRLVAVVQKRKA